MEINSRREDVRLEKAITPAVCFRVEHLPVYIVIKFVEETAIRRLYASIIDTGDYQAL